MSDGVAREGHGDGVKRVVAIQVAALGREFLRKHGCERLCGLPIRAADAVFPAVTCTAQAGFRTASRPARHGMVANGFLQRELARTLFWEQSARLVSGERIWDRARAHGARVALLFWQQSLGESVDIVLSPAPVHKHHGGMIPDCYGQPPELYADVTRAVGRPFNLARYWGPMASAESSRWIAEATSRVLERAEAPDVCFTYLPALDYDLQRYGPDHPRASRALGDVLKQIDGVVAAARKGGYEILIFGDYAIEACSAPVFPNRALLEAGLMRVRRVRGMLYPDLHASRAFAAVDHQVAHVYVREAADIEAAARVLRGLDGVGEVMDAARQTGAGIAHPRGGELVAVAAPGRWFAYAWWAARREAPEYATHVDIHNKPGYDPAELFAGMPPWQVSLDAARIRGTHGRVGAGMEIAWASTMIDGTPSDMAELAGHLSTWLNEGL